MGERKTDYRLVTLVAVVALTALLAMYGFAERHGFSPMSVTDITGMFTGYAIAADAPRVQPGVGSVILVHPEGAFDYTRDGATDARDGARLATLVDEDSCPVTLDCDIDNDGALTRDDVGAFNALLASQPQARREISAKTERPVGPEASAVSPAALA